MSSGRKDRLARAERATSFSPSTAPRESARAAAGRPSAGGPLALRRGAQGAQAIRLRQSRDATLKSTVGRPRKVTDAQIATILTWHDAILAWRAQRQMLKTLAELARELGLSRGTISSVIKHRGEFKQPSPEHREMELEIRRQLLEKVRLRGRRGPKSTS